MIVNALLTTGRRLISFVLSHVFCWEFWFAIELVYINFNAIFWKKGLCFYVWLQFFTPEKIWPKSLLSTECLLGKSLEVVTFNTSSNGWSIYFVRLPILSFFLANSTSYIRNNMFFSHIKHHKVIWTVLRQKHCNLADVNTKCYFN